MALPIKGRLRHAQLGLRRGHTRGRGVKLGLLLGRIEPGQEVAGIDVGADIHQAREHAPAHTKGEVGAETRLDLAGQREGSLSVLRLHNFGVHERGTLDGVTARSLQALSGAASSTSANAALMGLGMARAGGGGTQWCMAVSLYLNYTV